MVASRFFARDRFDGQSFLFWGHRPLVLVSRSRSTMNNDMANTHGDLLVKSVHKNNSLDHLMRGGIASRPPSAQQRPRSSSSSGRPRSRATSAAPTRQATPLSRQATTNRTSSAQPSYRSSLEKTEIQKKIDGDTGPAMIGVSSYPYSRSQSSYREDFEMLIASTITHPYISTTNMGQGSCPHNLLTGAPGPPYPPPKRTALTSRAGADWEQVAISRPRTTTGTASTGAPTRR